MTIETEQYGDTREELITKKLKKLLHRNITRTLYKYSSYDFYDNYGCIYELKSRCISINQYKTAFININKIRSNEHYKNMFLLYEYQNVEDGEKDLYFIKYDYELFNSFVKENYTYHIPIELLIKIDMDTDLTIFTPLMDTKLNVQFNKLISYDFNRAKIYGAK